MQTLIKILQSCSNFYSYLNYQYRKLRGKIAKQSVFDNYLEIVKNKSPEEINTFFKNEFEYKADGIDFAKHVLCFLYDKFGDCDDFANFYVHLLPKLGYETYLISIFKDSKTGHAVCVAKKNNQVYGFGNWRLMHFIGDFEDYISIGNQICRNGYQCDAEYIFKFDNKWKLQKYYKKS